MKLSMETVYFPESTFAQKKEMMADWERTSNRASTYSYICAATSVIMLLFMRGFKDEFFFIYGGSAALFLLGGYLCKKWSFLGYISVFLGMILCCARFNLDIIEGVHIISAIVVQAVFAVVPSCFAFRCAYNYNYVFKELRKCKGFPNFIANTADLYGEKIYLKDEEETVYEGRVKASYNPFSTDEQVREEEVMREMDARAKGESRPIRMDIGTDGAARPGRIRSDEVKYEHGKTIFGRELIFLHNDIATASYEEKKELMCKWRDNIEMTTKNFALFALLIMVAIMAANLGSLLGILNYAVMLVFIMGTNQMKMGKWYAPLTLLAATVYMFATVKNDIGLLCILGAFAFNFGLVLGTIRYVLNYRLYKELSKQPGFPSFIQTTADKYGSQLYVTEPMQPRPTTPTKRPVKVMDIGFDDKPKKDTGAWNAFDYMDKKDDEENEDNEG